MYTNHACRRAETEERSTIAGRLFSDHPRSLGMSWASHGIGALGIAFRLIGAGIACLIHAVVPGLVYADGGPDGDLDARPHRQAQSGRGQPQRVARL